MIKKKNESEVFHILKYLSGKKKKKKRALTPVLKIQVMLGVRGRITCG